jgi:hypothetical protein
MTMAKRPSIISELELATPAPRSQPATVEPPKPIKPRPDVQHTSVYIPREAFERLREIAFTERKKIHDLLMEGVDAVIATRGHSERARRTKT